MDNTDISFKVNGEKFNYRACAIIINDSRVLTECDENTPYRILPGGRVKLGESAEDAIVREMREELSVTLKIIRPLWFNQAFFTEEVNNIRYHELGIFFLMDISNTDLLSKGERFIIKEGARSNTFEWLKFEQLKNEYFYPEFLKEAIFDLPDNFTIRTEYE